MIGNGNHDAVFTKSLGWSDTLHPTLALNYSLGQLSGESATARVAKATCTIDADGTGSVLTILLTLKRYDETGTALADITYTISGAAAKVAWAGSDAAGWTASALTLKDVIDLINEIDGFQAFVLDAPLSLTVNSDDFKDLSATDIPTQPGKYLQTLYRDVSEACIDSDEAAFVRIGMPEVRDGGAFKIVYVGGTITGVTNGTIRIYRDDIREFDAQYNATYATELANKQVYLDKALVDTTLTAYIDDKADEAPVITGPVIVVVKSDDITTAPSFTIRLIPVNL